MPKEYNVNAVEINENKECKSCARGLNVGQKFIVLFSMFILGTSIYGTVKLVDLIINLF